MKKEKIEELRMKIATLQVDIDKNEKSQQYNDSLEQELLQELNETRDFTSRQEITDKIATLRAMRKELENKDLIEQLQDIKAQIQAEMNQCQQKIEAKKQKIGEIEQKNAKLQEDEKRYIAEIQENENIMELKKSKPSSKIYQSASEENKSLLQAKRGKISAMKRNDKKIKELANEISDLENTYAEFDKVLSEIEGRKQEKTEQPKKDETLDKPTDSAATSEQKVEGTIENPGIPKTVNENLGYDLKEDSEIISTSVLPSNRIKEAGFYIDDNGTPIYYVLIAKADGTKETYQNEGFEQIIPVDSEMEKNLKDKGIENASKYYDLGLATILQEVDKKYHLSGQQSGLTRYNDTMKNKALKDITKRAKIEIDYDFFNLYQMPTGQAEIDKIKYLKKLANRNYRENLASYEKAPNLLQRIWRKLTTKKLPVLSQERKVENADSAQEEMKELTGTERHNYIVNTFDQLYDEPGFEMVTFATHYKLTKEEEQELTERAHAKKLEQRREKLGVKLPDTIQEKVARNTQQIMKEQGQKEEKKDATIVIDK